MFIDSLLQRREQIGGLLFFPLKLGLGFLLLFFVVAEFNGPFPDRLESPPLEIETLQLWLF